MLRVANYTIEVAIGTIAGHDPYLENDSAWVELKDPKGRVMSKCVVEIHDSPGKAVMAACTAMRAILSNEEKYWRDLGVGQSSKTEEF